MLLYMNLFANKGLSSQGYQRRQWHPTLILLPGESHGWRSLVGCSPWGHTESDTTEATQQQQQSRLWFSQWSCMDVRVGLWRKLSAKKLMLLNCSVGEDSWEPIDYKEIKPVILKGNQFWIFIGRTDAETAIHWPPDVNSWLIGKDPDAGIE